METRLAHAIAPHVQSLRGTPTDYDALLESIGDARFVLIGEASHGTEEFYRERAVITRRLIEEKGFHAVAVEADWPDAYRVNRYVRAENQDEDAVTALGDFKRFPSWMWRNTVVVEFVEWLREYNDANPSRKAGFYGVDLYSLHASMQAVLDYLRKVDPEAARIASERYACFDHFGEDPQVYGYATSRGIDSCEQDVVAQLVDLQRRAAEYARRDGRVAEDEFFFAEQNARLARNAEEYYRSMYRGRVSSWNLRDQHMAETIDALDRHISLRVGQARIVVWEHNSHLGDARATEMGEAGELNVGQLVRQKHGDNAFLIGFTTFSGFVTAATDWDGPAERKAVRPGLPGSWEDIFHEVDAAPNFIVIPRKDRELHELLQARRLERAIGVIYRPETERVSHYFHARLSQQFDAILHIDHTNAVEPLERSSLWVPDELPETYPFTV